MDDLRARYFGGLDWYERLSEPRGPEDEPTAWYVAKSAEDAWYVRLLNAALAYADERGVSERYRTLFAGINPGDLTRERARADNRSVSFPIWEIANELIVALYLDRVLGWRFVEHAPCGRHQYRGDWAFDAPSGRRVFVEVKSLKEVEPRSTGVYSRPSYAQRIRGVLARAYQQLPQDDRATLVVLVGNELLRIPFGLMHGDIFQALYGQIQVRFNVMPYDPTSVRMGPSFREMFVQVKKHRGLGAAAGLVVGGLDLPGLRFYAIHNPFAHLSARIPPDDFRDIDQFVVDENWMGRIIDGIHPHEAWARIPSGPTS